MLRFPGNVFIEQRDEFLYYRMVYLLACDKLSVVEAQTIVQQQLDVRNDEFTRMPIYRMLEFLPNHFKGTFVGKLLKLLYLVCGYLFVAILLTQGTKMAQVMSFQTSPGLEISMSYIYAVIPISGSLMLLYLIRDTLRFLKGEDVKNEEVHS